MGSGARADRTGLFWSGKGAVNLRQPEAGRVTTGGCVPERDDVHLLALALEMPRGRVRVVYDRKRRLLGVRPPPMR